MSIHLLQGALPVLAGCALLTAACQAVGSAPRAASPTRPITPTVPATPIPLAWATATPIPPTAAPATSATALVAIDATLGGRTLQTRHVSYQAELKFVVYAGFLDGPYEGSVEVHFEGDAEACLHAATASTNTTTPGTLRYIPRHRHPARPDSRPAAL